MSRKTDTVHFGQANETTLVDASTVLEDRSSSEPRSYANSNKIIHRRRSKSNSKFIKIFDKIKSGYHKAKENINDKSKLNESRNSVFPACKENSKILNNNFSHNISHNYSQNYSHNFNHKNIHRKESKNHNKDFSSNNASKNESKNKEYLIYGETTLDENNSKWQIKSFEIEKLIGKGTYGIVYKAKSKNNQYYAIKSISYNKIKKNTAHLDKAFKPKEDLVRDMRRFTHLNHNNIIKLYAVVNEIHDDSIYLIYELGMRPLMVVPTTDTCTEIEALFYFRDIVNGLKYLHERKIAHLDLKPNNMILTTDYRVKLCDFGQSIIFDENFLSFYTVTGSVGYCAPELLARKECEHKIESFYISDIWSLGITLFCLIYGNIPWPAVNIMELIDEIINDYPKFPAEPDINPALYDLIGRMICKDPVHRITIQEVEEHPWVTIGGTLKFAFSRGTNQNDHDL